MIINENAILMAVVVIAAVFDYKSRKVPNIVTFPSIAAGLAMA